MKKLIVCLIVMLCTCHAWSQSYSTQSYLTLHSGEKIPYIKWKRDAKQFRVTREINGKRKKQNILIDSVQSYYTDYTTYYKKPVKGTGVKYDFYKREMLGKINLYTKTLSYFVSTGKYGGYSVTEEHLYFEKGNSFEQIMIPSTLVKNKKSGLETLRSLIQDDPDTLAKLESDDFKYRAENVIRLIREYNY
jgi:hypothetical protein